MTRDEGKDKKTSSILISRKPEASLGAFIGDGSKIVGKMYFSGPVELCGEVEGEIQSEGKLTIGETCKAKAEIKGIDVIVKGEVEGNITAESKLILRSPAKVTGNIRAFAISVEEGVIFNGQCEMMSDTPMDQNKTETNKGKKDKPIVNKEQKIAVN